jgi:hypothetical protein
VAGDWGELGLALESGNLEVLDNKVAYFSQKSISNSMEAKFTFEMHLVLYSYLYKVLFYVKFVNWSLVSIILLYIRVEAFAANVCGEDELNTNVSETYIVFCLSVVLWASNENAPH